MLSLFTCRKRNIFTCRFVDHIFITRNRFFKYRKTCAKSYLWPQFHIVHEQNRADSNFHSRAPKFQQRKQDSKVKNTAWIWDTRTASSSCQIVSIVDPNQGRQNNGGRNVLELNPDVAPLSRQVGQGQWRLTAWQFVGRRVTDKAREKYIRWTTDLSVSSSSGRRRQLAGRRYAPVSVS